MKEEIHSYIGDGKPIYTISQPPKLSDWECHLYGSKPDGMGMVYTPSEGNVPNWFVRYMMKICLGCSWVKGNECE